MNALSEIRPLTPTQLVSRLIDLQSAYQLGLDGYCMRAGYDAREQLQELVAELITDGRLMAWAQCAEQAELAERTRRFA